MNKIIEKFGKSFSKIIKNFLNSKEIDLFLKLYNDLPVTVNNLKQKVIKKKMAYRLWKRS